MSCDSGLIQILSLNVPQADNSLGDPLDVSSLIGKKTFVISGSYAGKFTILGSHDGISYTPLLTFDSGSGAQQAKNTFDLILKYLKVQREARNVVGVSIQVSSQQTCSTNNFVVLPVIPVGAIGPQQSTDLWSVVPPNGVNPNLSAFAFGKYKGTIVVEGSLDNTNFAPIGNDLNGFFAGGFPVSQQSDPNQTLNIPPISITDTIRYIRLSVARDTYIYQAVKVTLGTLQNEDCSSSGGGSRVFDNVDDMVAAGSQGTFNNEAGLLLGYYSPNDDGGGNVYWDSTSVETADGGSIFQVSGTATGRWKRIFENGIITVKQFGAKGIGVSFDDTTRIIAAIASIRNSFEDHEPKIFVIEATDNFYKITQTLVFDDYWNLTIRFTAQGIERNEDGTQFRWYGAANLPVIRFTGVCKGIRIEMPSINGNAGGSRALCGFMLGSDGDTNFAASNWTWVQPYVIGCRWAAMYSNQLYRNLIGEPQIDIMSHDSIHYEDNTDGGIYLGSGNLAGISFSGGAVNRNGSSPTVDAYNTAGIGANVFANGGKASFLGMSSTGSGANKPTNADIYQSAGSLDIVGWWSDTHGLYLKQSGPVETCCLKGIRHYASDMTDVNTPSSLDVTQKCNVDGAYLFGDYVGNSSVLGNMTGIGIEFADFPLKRPTLGRGTFKGDLKTNFRAVVNINPVGNTGQIIVGGGDRDLVQVGSFIPQLLSLGADPDAVYNSRSLLQALSKTVAGSGYTITGPGVDGMMELWINCYSVNTSGTSYKTHKIGVGYVIRFGSSSTTSGLTVLKYTFPDTTTAVAIGTFTQLEIPAVLSNTDTLDFPNITTLNQAELTITVTGAVVGNAVSLSPPAALEAGLAVVGYVSAANTVTVRLLNCTALSINPASASWTAKVFQ